MIPVNRQPAGLLSFFGIKNSGRFPGWPDAAQYWPCFDLTRFALNDPLAVTTQQNSLSLVGVGNNNTVAGVSGPAAGKLWYLLEAAWTSGVLGAGQTGQAVLTCAYPSAAGLSALPIGPQSLVETVGGQIVCTYASPGMPLIMPAGALLGVLPSQIAAGPITGSLLWRYVEVSI